MFVIFLLFTHFSPINKAQNSVLLDVKLGQGMLVNKLHYSVVTRTLQLADRFSFRLKKVKLAHSRLPSVGFRS